MSEAVVTLYGISNCDTVKKARGWLREHNIAHDFHDYRKDGLDETLLRRFEAALGWQAMLNRRGTSWRKLPEQTREAMDRDGALAAMQDNPALIKRPLTVHSDGIEIGFDAARYSQLFG